MVHVHVHGRKRLQNRLAERRIDLHGVQRIVLIDAAGFDLEGLADEPGCSLLHIVHDVLPHRVNIRRAHRCAPGRSPRYRRHGGERVDRLLLVPVTAAFHIDPASLFPDLKLPLYAELQADLLRERVLKDMTVFPLIPISPYLIKNVWYIDSSQVSSCTFLPQPESRISCASLKSLVKVSKSITDCSALRAPTILPTIRAPWGPCPTTHSLWGVSTPLSPTASKLAWETGF